MFHSFHSSHTCWLKVQSWESGQKSSFVLYSWPWELQYRWFRFRRFFFPLERNISFFSVFVSVSIRLSQMTKRHQSISLKALKYVPLFETEASWCYRDVLAYKSYSLDVRERACWLRSEQKITSSPKWDSNLHWVICLGKQVVLPPTPPSAAPPRMSSTLVQHFLCFYSQHFLSLSSSPDQQED